MANLDDFYKNRKKQLDNENDKIRTEAIIRNNYYSEIIKPCLDKIAEKHKCFSYKIIDSDIENFIYKFDINLDNDKYGDAEIYTTEIILGNFINNIGKLTINIKTRNTSISDSKDFEYSNISEYDLKMFDSNLEEIIDNAYLLVQRSYTK